MWSLLDSLSAPRGNPCAMDPRMMDGYDKQGCLHDMFVRQARATPHATAVVTHDGTQMTFAELDHASDVLALRLRHLGVTNNTVVGILMERCLEYTITYIGILKAGGAYMPLEVSYPPTLLQAVLEDSEPPVVCTKTSFAKRLSGAVDPDHVVLMEDNWMKEMDALNKQAPPLSKPVVVSLDDMAYTVYSSGTTGKPKGIQCPHRGAVFSYTWRHIAYPYQKDDREACNVFFVWEMLRPLLKGVPMYIIPDDVIYDPARLVAFIGQHKITRMTSTPSLLEAVLDARGLDVAKGLESMRQLWFCGEVVTTILRNRIMGLLPWIKLMNFYSISEAHDATCIDLSIEPEGKETRKFCSVGKCLPQVQLVILDEEMNPQPVGAPGEIYVGGPTLAIGYLNRPDVNVYRFITRPPNVPASVGERLYRTGDWGYILSDGTLEICGRCDTMVKIRGYSVEIQAIEAAMLDLPNVVTGCVLCQGEEGSDKMLVAYIVPDGNTSRKEIRAALKKRLPFYMIPSKFVFLKSIPIVEASGKLDKKSLPKIESGIADDGIDPQDLPSTPCEHRLSAIWCEVLRLHAVDVNENFFDLGGHSLLATRLLAEMNARLGLSLGIGDLFSYPTVYSLARYLEDPVGAGAADGVKIDLMAEVERHDQGKTLIDIRLRAFWRSFQLSTCKSRRDKILLTGATGYVGAFVLDALLRSTKSTVYCLVRESPGIAPMERIRKAFRDYGINTTGGEDAAETDKRLEWRVVPIKGDITVVNLGMSEDDYMYLSYEVDSVIHAAALVNLVYPYRAMYSANVLGTENVLQFAQEHKIKPLHHVSTDAVFPAGLNDCREDADMGQYADQLTSGYAQSKWVSEQLVLRARQRGHPVAIYRCGNVAGSQDEPGWNPADFTLLMLQGCIYTHTVPDVNWQIELTPADFVGKVIASMTHNVMKSIGKTFHLINTTTMDCSHLWQLMRVQGYPVNTVPFDQWRETIRKEANENIKLKEVLTPLLYLLDNLVKDASYFSNLTTFTRENLDLSLQTLGWTYPAVNTELMRTYFRHLSRVGHLPKPRRTRKDTAQLLHGKVALVTGASSGIGAAIAEHLAVAGAKVAIAARRLDRLHALQQQIEKQGGIAISVEMDVTDNAQVTKAVAHIESLLGPVDILVNNAGVMYYTMMKNVNVEQWRQTIDVNCTGVVNCLGAVLAGMVERKHGHIVNISSDAGRKAFPGLAVYSGTKFFVEAMSRALREEVVDSKVKVTCIQPGDVKTELHGHTTDHEAQEMYDVSSKIKTLESQDIAQAVLYALTQPGYVAINEILIEPREAPI